MGRLAVVAFVLMCFGMAGGAYYLMVQQPTQTAQRADTVEGTVVATDIDTSTSDSSTTYGPVVEYEYRYAGQTYTNDNIRLVGDPGFPSPGGAEEYLQSYTAGDTVTVHVDSENPERSYLERGSVGLLAYGIVAFLAFLGGLGVVALVADLRGADWVDIK
jgi:hypothetical protein